jgi:hypothetical protein
MQSCKPHSRKRLLTKRHLSTCMDMQHERTALHFFVLKIYAHKVLSNSTWQEAPFIRADVGSFDRPVSTLPRSRRFCDKPKHIVGVDKVPTLIPRMDCQHDVLPRSNIAEATADDRGVACNSSTCIHQSLCWSEAACSATEGKKLHGQSTACETK